MAIHLPHVEDSNMTNYYPPKGEYVRFEEEEHYAQKGREWGLFNKSTKEEFWYKGKTYQRKVKIIGYEVHGTHNTAIIEFQDGNLSCIHPAYLKEMQSPNFGKEVLETEEKEEEEQPTEEKSKKQSEEKKEKPKSKEKPKKEKKEKLLLPEGKVSFQATVKEVAKKMNHFTQEEEEFLLFENVFTLNENREVSLEIGNAYAGYSKTLKSKELNPNDTITFEGKVVEKKFNKEYPYKLNNPGKIEKK